MLKYSVMPVLHKFLSIGVGAAEGLSLTMTDRGLPPSFAKGSIHFTCPIRKSLKAFQVRLLCMSY